MFRVRKLRPSASVSVAKSITSALAADVPRPIGPAPRESHVSGAGDAPAGPPPVDQMDALVIHQRVFAFEQDMQPSIAKPRPQRSIRLQPLKHCHVGLTGASPIAPRLCSALNQMSSVCSAAICFDRRLSSSTCFGRYLSLSSIPPDFAFQRSYVRSVIRACDSGPRPSDGFAFL